MGKRVKIVLAALAVALVSVLVWHIAQPHEPTTKEPVYKGRTLMSWLKDVGADGIIPGDPVGMASLDFHGSKFA